MRTCRALLLSGLFLALGSAPAVPAPDPVPEPGVALPAKVFLTVDEALELAFPDCEVEKDVSYLTEEQAERAHELAGIDVPQKIVHAYRASRGGELVGTAYFDAHKVRTLKETVMFVVDPSHTIVRFELLSFGEPTDYIPRGSWYDQFLGRPLDDELNLKRGIRSVTGATLTARSTTEAARRSLALHAVLYPRSDS